MEHAGKAIAPSLAPLSRWNSFIEVRLTMNRIIIDRDRNVNPYNELFKINS